MIKFKTFFLALAFLVLALPAPIYAADEMLYDQIKIQTRDGAEYLFNVELALNPAQQAKGLMDRTMLAENAGMLFVFGDEEMRSFWMKDTLIPLDMIFIAKDGTIRHIHHMARPQDTAHITSNKPVSAVLEINGGFADKLGLSEGDKVLNSVFRNSFLAQ